jgi:dUTPase
LANDFGIVILGGVVDRNYIGPVGVVAANVGFYRDGVLVQVPWTIKPGDKICQIVPKIIPDVREAIEANSFDPTKRGSDGFGST